MLSLGWPGWRETRFGVYGYWLMDPGLTRKGLCPFLANPGLPRCSPLGAGRLLVVPELAGCWLFAAAGFGRRQDWER